MQLATVRRLWAVLLCCGLLLVAERGHASVQLNLVSVANLADLVVGEAIVIRVELAGLDETNGEVLDFLAASVVGPGALIGTPLSPIAGPIVPDATGFSSFGALGLADGFYDAVFADTGEPISANGVFFEFEVTPIAVGRGSFSFDFVDGLPGPVIGGQPLEFVIGPGGSAGNIPEPSAAVAWSLIAASVGIASYASRRRVRSADRA